MKMRKSFGAEVAEIANELNIPKTTVEEVLRTRLKHQVADIKAGNSVTVEGLFTIKVSRDVETGELQLRGSVSQTLKSAVSDDKKLRMVK